MPAVQETVEQVRQIDVDQYKYGFETLIESEKAPKGLSEDTIRFISAKKDEPAWMLEWRLEAYRRWLTMREPQWARVDYGPIDYQDAYYYSEPKAFKAPKSLDDIDPEILKTYDARHPLRGARRCSASRGARRREAARTASVARAIVSRSMPCSTGLVATTFKEELKKVGVIFMPISESAARASRPGEEVSGSVCRCPTTSRDAQRGGVLRRLVHVRRACAARWSCRPISASMRRTPAVRRTLIIADKGSRELPRRLHRGCATRTSYAPRWSS
jgi:Fe-S cluster assembly protein SufB